MRRVVVTGIGVISAIGKNAAEFEAALRGGRPGIGPITQIDTSHLRFRKGAEVRDFDPAEYFPEAELRWIDRFCQLGLIAAREAISDCALAWTEELRATTGVVTGSCLGGISTQDGFYFDLYHESKSRSAPSAIPRTMSNALASQLTMEQKFTGPSFTTSTACSSSSHALGQAFWLVRQGTLEVAIAGGSEAPLVYGPLKAWESMRVIANDTCRPFSRDRSGMVLGEGAAMLVLENLEGARHRGAHIYGEIVGFGMSADAHHLTKPFPEGGARAINAALADAQLAPDHIDYVNAHATGTQVSDAMEAEALRLVFGERARVLPVSSTKSMHGHTLGAAGAIEAAATLLALDGGFLPPTANFTEPDPECDLDVVPNESRCAHPEAAISNAFAFGGLNAVLAFKRFR